MAKDSFKVKKSLNIKPTDPSTLTNREAGDIIVDSTDNNKLKTYNPSSDTYQSVSTPGGLDTVFVENLESNTSSSFTTGQNATPDAAGTGTLGGAVSDETSSQISGERSLKYTMNATAASSDNDFFLNDTDIVLDAKHKGNFIGISFYYTYDGADNDIRFFVLDQDDNEITQSDEYIKANTNPTRFSTSVFVPSDDTGLRYGFQVVTGNSSKVFIIDDIEFSTNPFVYKNLVEKGFVHYDTHAGFGSTNTVIPYFTNETSNNNISKFGTVVNDSALGFSFTANRRLKVTAIYSFNSGVNGTGGFSLNGVPTTGITAISTNQRVGLGALSNTGTSGTATASVIMESGDVLRPHTDSFAADNTSRHFVTILAEAEAEHVVTPAKSTLTDWESYTPTTQGFGTVTNMDARWRRVGDTIEVKATWNNGTVAASEAQFGLPNSYTVGDGSTEIVGTWGRAGGGSAQEHGGVALATDGDAFVNISDRAIWSSTGKDTLTPANGNRTGINSEKMSIEFSVQVSELTSDATFLAAVPMNYTQTKTLANDLPTGSMSELDFNNLVIGNWYEVTLQVKFGPATSTSDNSAQITHDSTVIGSVEYASAASGSSSGVTAGTTVKFKATATTVTFSGIGGGMPIQGNGTQAETFAQLTELNYTKETTRFE